MASPVDALLAAESEGDATPTAAPRHRSAVDALLALDSDEEAGEATLLPTAFGGGAAGPSAGSLSASVAAALSDAGSPAPPATDDAELDALLGALGGAGAARRVEAARGDPGSSEPSAPGDDWDTEVERLLQASRSAAAAPRAAPLPRPAPQAAVGVAEGARGGATPAASSASSLLGLGGDDGEDEFDDDAPALPPPAPPPPAAPAPWRTPVAVSAPLALSPGDSPAGGAALDAAEAAERAAMSVPEGDDPLLRALPPGTPPGAAPAALLGALRVRAAVDAERALRADAGAPRRPPAAASGSADSALGAAGLLRVHDHAPLAARLLGSEHGLPQCVAASPMGVAVGMSSGAILLARSEAAAAAAAAAGALSTGANAAAASLAAAAAAAAASSEATVVVLLPGAGQASGAAAASAAAGAAVSCLAFGPGGEWLLAGYADGTARLWDASKAALLKELRGVHRAQVVAAALLAGPARGGGDALTADAAGVACRHSLATMGPMLPMRVRTTSLGEKTPVLDLRPLPPPLPSPAAASGIADVPADAAADAPEAAGLVAVVTPAAVVLMRMHPEGAVVGKVGRPRGVAASAPDATGAPAPLPCAAWAPRRLGPGGAAPTGPALLAVAWGADVRVFAVTLRKRDAPAPPSPVAPDAGAASSPAVASPPAASRVRGAELSPVASWTADAPALALSWCDDVALVALSGRRFAVLYAPGGAELDRAPSGEPPVSREASAAGGRCVAAACASAGPAAFMLGASRLRCARLLGWRERVGALAEARDWGAALAAAVAAAHGAAPALPPAGVEPPPGRAAAAAAAAGVVLQAYLASALDGCADDARWAAAARAAVEACLQLAAGGDAARRDAAHATLFGAAVRGRFAAAGRDAAFLAALVAPICAGALPALPPEVVQALVGQASAAGDAASVERCVLHLDLASLDFDQVARACAQHRLHSALAHLYADGLDDFVAPAEAMLRAATQEADGRTTYKLLLYLRECFRGRRFPPGRGALPASRLPSLKAQLLCWLLTDDASDADATSSPRLLYPRLRALLRRDAPATLSVLREAFDGWDAAEEDVVTALPGARVGGALPSAADVSGDDAAAYVVTGRSAAQMACEAVVHCAEGVAGGEPQAPAVASACLAFAAAFVGAGRAALPPPVLRRVAASLALGPPAPSEADARPREAELIALLAAAPIDAHEAEDTPEGAETDAQPQTILAMARAAGFRQAAAYVLARSGRFEAALREAAADDGYAEGAADVADALLSGAGNADFNVAAPSLGGAWDAAYPAAAANAGGASAQPPRAGGAAAALRPLADAESAGAVRAAVFAALPALVTASAPASARLVALRLRGDASAAMRALSGAPAAQFALLRELLAPGLGAADAASADAQQPPPPPPALAAALLRAGGTGAGGAGLDDVADTYVALLCRYDPRGVRPFLLRAGGCHLGRCLATCQREGVDDAAALLLERMGRPQQALDTMLRGLRAATAAMQAAARAADADDGDEAAAEAAAAARGRAAAALEDAIALCIRHTAPPDAEPDAEAGIGGIADDDAPAGAGGAVPEEPHALWFALLDAALAPLSGLRGASAAERSALSASLERVLLSLRPRVPAAALVAKVVRDYGGAGLGQLRSALAGTLRSAAADAALHAAAAAAVAADAAAARTDVTAQARRALPAQRVHLSEPDARCVAYAGDLALLRGSSDTHLLLNQAAHACAGCADAGSADAAAAPSAAAPCSRAVATARTFGLAAAAAACAGRRAAAVRARRRQESFGRVRWQHKHPHAPD